MGKMDKDRLYTLLSNRRRRMLCCLIQELDCCIGLGDVSELLAAQEHCVERTSVSSTQRKRIYISLYQVHLPKLDEARILRYDENRKTIRPGRYLNLMCGCIGAVNEKIRDYQADETMDGCGGV